MAKLILFERQWYLYSRWTFLNVARKSNTKKANNNKQTNKNPKMNTNIKRFSQKQYWAGSDCEVNFTTQNHSFIWNNRPKTNNIKAELPDDLCERTTLQVHPVINSERRNICVQRVGVIKRASLSIGWWCSERFRVNWSESLSIFFAPFIWM